MRVERVLLQGEGLFTMFPPVFGNVIATTATEFTRSGFPLPATEMVVMVTKQATALKIEEL